MTRLMISVGEPSGDRLAGLMLRELRELRPDLELCGVAGPSLRELGVEELASIEELSVMGLVEVVGAIPRLREVMDRLVEGLASGVDLLVVVDFSGFNIRLAKRAKELGVPVLFYVSPQVWAWRKKRAAVIADLAEEVLCLLPFEPEHYTRHGGRATFVGHPLATVKPSEAAERRRYLLLPGSREGEVGRLLPTMLDVAEMVRSEDAECEVVVAAAPGWSRERLEEASGRELGDISVVDGIDEGARGTHAALVASGTATLELACRGVPMVVVYRLNATTHWILRRVVKGVEFIALPNIIANRSIAPEFIQHLDPAELAEALVTAAHSDQREQLLETAASLQGEGASRRAAEHLLRHLPDPAKTG